MELIGFNGWENCVRLANRAVELIATTEVGPRIIRFGFHGGRNLFAEIAGEQGGRGEESWKIRGGHRLWFAPEDKNLTYEPDNSPVKFEAIRGGVRLKQSVGPLSRIQKTMDVMLDSRLNRVRVVHTLTNRGRRTVQVAPWALSVMAPGGVAVIPLPPKVPHSQQLTHNQQWSIWSYTDFSDGRWFFGKHYIFFRQDHTKGPAKLGIVHREGWVAYLHEGLLFVKRFERVEGALYPDGGVNFETFANEHFLELESLGPLVNLSPNRSVQHEEVWQLYGNVPDVLTERDMDEKILPILKRPPIAQAS